MTALPHPSARLVDGPTGTELAGPRLVGEIAAAAERLTAQPPGLMLTTMPTRTQAVIRYLAALASGRPVALLDPGLPADFLLDLVARFTPAVVAGPPAALAPPYGYRADGDSWVCPGAPQPHHQLAVLLTTSGSTGNPKLVRLSRSAVFTNARTVARALRLAPGDLWPTTLPLHYTYGLTTLNCHLAAGAGVLVTEHGLLDRPFWSLTESFGATVLATVPYHFEMLRRLRFDPSAHPKLRMITQAGGRLRGELVTEFGRRMSEAGGGLVKMYGMTEAPRISMLPAERLADKPTSVGPAISGGALSIDNGEVVYRGPNVMMGYAEHAADLMRGDDLGGMVRTGDLGHLDDEGFLYIDGRLRRIGKVFGVRVNLDDLEWLLPGHGPVAAVAGDDRVVVWVEEAGAAARREVAKELGARLGLHWSGFDVRAVDRLPLLGTGKVDYRTLEERT
ncbi:AMP-dependent acyl-CoA synthetase [Microtetraspora sp. NBRC 13810]|uniref:AMP-binding protein n=1 Tax=Microtetraspora sp. NBRC 13810 TaxID=3030990 RepID=UPI0024A43FF9|nr:AMP-binding protein [Microtetraspora sp. NBRC 13810]GLW05547.1 AMP-dependent acyl-CoA synthetase [Microtetraspora sp. NBRC 13810]